MENGMARLDAAVVSVNHNCIHVLHRNEWPKDEFRNDILMIKMLIAGEPENYAPPMASEG